jgi:hypothetical protein
MVKESNLQTIIATVGSIVPIIVVLLGTAAGWGTLKSRIGTLEARVSKIEKEVDDIDDEKVSKEDHHYLILEMKNDYKNIKNDLRVIRDHWLKFDRGGSRKR